MGDSISVTIEERRVEVTVLTPNFIQVNLLEPVVLKSVSENSAFVGAEGYNDLPNKITLVDADIISAEDSTSGFAKIKVTFANLKATLKTYFDTIYQKIFNTQNLGTISAAKTINATDFSTITGDFTTSFTSTFEGFTASRKSVLLHLVVSGGGSPTITIAGYTFKFMTTANLTAMADGTYQVVVNNPKTDGNAFVYVKLAP